MLVHVNGVLVEESRAGISIFDRGFLYGDGIFESMRAVNGTVFRLARHLDRLRHSADLIGLDLPGQGRGLGAAIDEVLRANQLVEARIRVTVTRGPGRPGDYVEASGPPTQVIVAQPFSGLETSMRDAGVSVVLSGRQVPAEALDPAIKTTSRLASVLARREAQARGAFEALFLDPGGRVTEGTVSNLFMVDGAGTVVTPPLAGGCLPGVTREAVIEVARAQGVVVREAALPAAALTTAAEIFLTNTSWDLLPVVRLGDRPVGGGSPGTVTRRLLLAYRDLVRRECGRG